jgi:hypothetical protein
MIIMTAILRGRLSGCRIDDHSTDRIAGRQTRRIVGMMVMGVFVIHAAFLRSFECSGRKVGLPVTGRSRGGVNIPRKREEKWREEPASPGKCQEWWLVVVTSKRLICAVHTRYLDVTDFA